MLNVISGLLGNGVAASTNSYESIATVTPTSGTVVTFTSIPSTFKHLQIRVNGVSSAAYSFMRVGNGSIDTAANYSYHGLYGTGSSAGAQGGSSDLMYIFNAGSSTTYPAVAVVDILDYQNTNKYKTIRSLAGYDANGSGSLYYRSGNWRNTAAIDTLNLTIDSGGYAAGSSIALYGIKG